MELVNPLAAYSDAYNLLEGQAQDRARRTAGSALASGDYQGAQNALYSRGMLDQAAGVGQLQQQQEDRGLAKSQAQLQADATHRKEVVDRLEWSQKALAGLKQLPTPEARAAAYQQHLRPVLVAMGVDQAELAKLDQTTWDDATVDGLAAVTGQEAQKWQGVNLGDGGFGAFNAGASNPLALGPDGKPANFVVYREPTPKPVQAPLGYRTTPTGLEAIPGGPADPKVAGTLASVKRAPKAKKSGGSTSPAVRTYGSGENPVWGPK